MPSFTHLHVHSQYSILDGASGISDLVSKASSDGMQALALTDHGSMFGIKEFHQSCIDGGLKPILGCETYVARRSIKDRNDKADRSGDHLILLAKNKGGYHNLLKLVSIANVEGMYYRPRIDKVLLEKYSEGLIVTSACLGGEVPRKIMNGDIEGAELAIEWFKRVFKDDYYLEVQLHPSDDPQMRADIYERQVGVNKVIVDLASKHGVKVIATNDVHFVNEEDADAHDILICLNTGTNYDDESRMRYTRQEWLKTCAEMGELFSDIPEALDHTNEISEKVEVYELNSSPIMPEFHIPKSFGSIEEFEVGLNEDSLRQEFGDSYDRLGGFKKVARVKFESEYLRHLVYKGVKEKYGEELEESSRERIDFELETIKSMGFPGYFLIVQDFICAARRMGVIVGPGRGSAAGSVVSYAIGITNIDPVRYNLLFERFLNPDRISMPDIDIDFDDDGRDQVIEWVANKYGSDKVAHICTFGTMAAKMAIRDVARVLRLPLSEADRLAKMIPDAPKMTLKKAYAENPGFKSERQSDDPLVSKTIKLAEALEGSVRHTGIHACGILIGRNPLSEHLPVMPTKGESILTTQYDGGVVEDIGLLKMDLLGLKTLSIIKECIENVKLSKGIDIDIDKIPDSDDLTFSMFSSGDTTAIFQFESPGMKKWLKQLRPNCFEDLVAMNALYRPGPMEYIPNFIARKHGDEKIVYDHPMMELFLKETYGITVFQEQVMLQARNLGLLTKGESDELRKAMGKKKGDLMEKLKVKFREGCLRNKEFIDGCGSVNKRPDELISKIWTDWEAFASYAFNKSHSVCYARIAYQTGYLKAHYPAEFMSAVLSRNLGSIEKISMLMDECNHVGLPVLVPDVNESRAKFFVNKDGALRFGLAAIKGVGGSAVENIISSRDEGGEYKDIFDFVERVNLQAVNKKSIESLAMAGAFDGFEGLHRSHFFAENSSEKSFAETLLRYGNLVREDSNSEMESLFGDSEGLEIKKPSIPDVPEYPKLKLLENEKAVVGVYLSAHPLDPYKFDMERFCTTGVTLFKLSEDIGSFQNRDIIFAGMVESAHESVSKNGNPFSVMTMIDYTGSYKMFLFGRQYIDFGKFCKSGLLLIVTGRVLQNRGRDTWDFRIKDIDLLSEKREQIDRVVIEVPSESVTPEFVNEFGVLADKNGGETAIQFAIRDEKERCVVRKFSRMKRIILSDEVLDYLQKREDIVFTIN